MNVTNEWKNAKTVFSQACACRLVAQQSQDTYFLLGSSAHPVYKTSIMKQLSRLNFNNNDDDNYDVDDDDEEEALNSDGKNDYT